MTSFSAAQRVNVLRFINEQEIELADPQYYIPNKIDMLLGAEIYSQIILDGLKKGSHGTPVAQCTSFGWIISGSTGLSCDLSSPLISMHVSMDDDDALKKFWELEAEPSSKPRILTDDEKSCEHLFTTTTQRDIEGRYIVKLPLRDEDPDCKRGQFRDIAERRFNYLEAKFKRDRELKNKYSEVINEYIQLGHMELITGPDEKRKEAVYLPHHAIIRNDRDTTKLRVVFDASTKGKNGVSLNDNLMVGPTLQPELRHLLMQWRLHPICMVADIVKMYRQVRVTEQDTNFQRILWRENDKSKLLDYRLLRVTFGTASAPYLAVRAMQQIAYDECGYTAKREMQTNVPDDDDAMIGNKILNNFYIDDLMTGCENVEMGLKIYNQINTILAKGGFELQKWSSNSSELMNELKEKENKLHLGEVLKIKQDNVIKVLGITWNRTDDSFQYSVTLPTIKLMPETKRKIISCISKLFDPLGWLAPSVVLAKIFIQKLWLAGIGWDEEVPNDILKEWTTYRQELPHLTQIHVPRWLGTSKTDKLVELHGFCDASKVAYAAVVYARIIDMNGVITVRLITAKTKVAPIKTISVPRLELCGASLLTKLLSEVCIKLKFDRNQIWAWTDSEVVIAWLCSHPSRWKTFVANRTSEILNTIDSKQWHHVPSNQNPADCASRGVLPSILINTPLWFKGPEFLKERFINPVKQINIVTKLEQATTNSEKIKTFCITTEKFIWENYSSLTKLLRIIAFCRRFLRLLKPRSERTFTEYLTCEELNKALEICITKTQRDSFKDELNNVKNHSAIKKGEMKSLNPYIDDRNILRVGGRLELSGLPYQRIHPILIPKKSFLTNLLIANAHLNTLHGGPRLMLSYLNSKYYIFGAKSLTKLHVRQCVTCIRQGASTNTQLMGQIPAVRITPSKVFRHSGVDYAGPISLRTSKGRGHHAYKGYICLFVCMTTKAVHIEIVSDMTSQGFLAAFKRFIARRGHCSDLWSDNGTNFQGASKELMHLFSSENSRMINEIAEALVKNKTNWHFIPPHSPNFGGLWESAIKSCKHHLKRVIGNSTLTYEEMATLLSQIEACLNSRPLSRLDSSENVEVLTPGHFLVGEPLITAPDNKYETSTISSLRRWQLTQRMLQDFWKRWSQEYLNSFLHRYKWSQLIPEPKVGDAVLIKEDDLPPCRWLLGRVLNKHPGVDGLTRVVTLQIKNSVIKRPTSKICILPVAKDS